MNQSTASAEPMASLEIRKGADAQLDVGGLRFVACRREVDVIDGGITLYVRSAGDDRELLRFDLFRHRPHYHAPAENAQETVIDASTAASVDEWGVENLTRRAGELVAESGHLDVSPSLDLKAIGAAGPALRRLLAGLAEPTEISTFPIPSARLAEIRATIEAPAHAR
jgi:hypothetical protein